MKIVKEGDKRKAICPNCGVIEATYALRDVDFSDGSGTVKNILAAVCSQCDEVVSIPHQSTAKIRAEYNNIKKPLDVRVPAHYLDILTLAAQRIDANANESFNKALVRYYLHALSSHHYSSKGLDKLLDQEVAKAKATKSFSMKVSLKTWNDVDALKKDLGFRSRSDVLKSIILKINEDLLQNETPKHLRELQSFAAAYG